MHEPEFRYEVAFSFAEEDRAYVREVANALNEHGVRVFYDEYETAALWGKNLYSHLRDVYSNQARYTVIFISHYYASKVWTNLERESAQARALRENREYILPARFDSTELPGMLETVGYVNLQGLPPSGLAKLILAKISPSTPSTPQPSEREAKPALLQRIQLAVQMLAGDKRCYVAPNIPSGILERSKLYCKVPDGEKVYAIIFSNEGWFWERKGKYAICLTELGLYAHNGTRVRHPYSDFPALEFKWDSFLVYVARGQASGDETRYRVHLGRDGLRLTLPYGTAVKVSGLLNLIKSFI